MKIKVIVLSFLITFFLSLSFVIPQLVQDHLQVYLGDLQSNLATYGFEMSFESISMSYIPMRIRINQLKISRGESETVLAVNRAEFSNWSANEIIQVLQGELSLSDLTKLKLNLQQEKCLKRMEWLNRHLQHNMKG